MGLDLTFVEPTTNTEENPDDVDYQEPNSQSCDNAILRIIHWFPYTEKSMSDPKHPPPYSSIRSNANKTFGEFKSWLVGLREWILDNRAKYIYLPKHKYDWQIPFYPNKDTILFGDIESMNSPDKPDRTIHPNLFLIQHTIYWSDKRPLRQMDMIHDAMLVQRFIDYIENMGIDDNWLVKFH